MGIVQIRRPNTDPTVRKSVRRLLESNWLAAFATVDPRGRAHVHTAYFAWYRDWSLFFYSYPDSRHCLNLETRPAMAVAVFDSHQRWGHPDRGVQLFGTCREATRQWKDVATSVYARRFPGFKKWKARTEQGDGSFELRPYRFRPNRAKLLDERVFGAGTFVEFEIS